MHLNILTRSELKSLYTSNLSLGFASIIVAPPPNTSTYLSHLSGRLAIISSFDAAFPPTQQIGLLTSVLIGITSV